MDTYLIDVPMPSMGATVNELTVVSLKTKPGAQVEKGAKLAELESDKSVFEFESPCAGTVKEIFARAGDVRASGAPLFRLETADAALRHLEAKGPGPAPAANGAAAGGALVWTPRAAKLAQEAGLDPTRITDIEATGPGRRVSGDDVARYLAARKA
ncbi:MAG TPA: biotin/lipoyl-containing protein [Opitutaceae bacterium]|jgi:pyruvate/2-oxoglutarate dehydrogenase complex dihydrolipoamide acyltransferase (E2) component|nr:biotin/lipoyl-containing protein [Opitutaceae bacterium]